MENLKLDDFTKYKFLSGVKYSPNGKKAGFIVHRMDVEENCYLSNLWIYDIEKESYNKLTSFGKETSFIWLNDCENILFPSIRDENDREKADQGEIFTQYYRININGGEAEKAFKIPLKVEAIRQIDENNFLIIGEYNINKVNLNDLEGKEREEQAKKIKDEKDYEVLDEIPFWSNGDGFTNKNRNRLYIYNTEKNLLNPITDEYTNVLNFNLSADKTEIVFIANSYKGKMPLNDDIYIYCIKSGELKKVSPYEYFNYEYVNFMSKETLIFLGSSMKNYGVNENSKFYKMDMKTNETICLTEGKDFSTWDSVGSDSRYGNSQHILKDGRYIYFITTEMDNSYINRIDENGNIKKITKGKGSVDGFDVINGNVIMIAMRRLKLEELYKIDNEKEVQITDFNGWVIYDKKLSRPERINVETAPGVTIEGWILKPVDFEDGKKYPAILDVHGGPKTVYGEVFFHEMQYWANHGYAVFFCNPRGSDGRGNEFADIRGKYGTIDYDDLMKFTDAVLEKYSFIDKDRVGVTGGSYGGFMTNWIIGHTDRFKAAASQRSISNWISKFCTTDIGYYFVEDQNGATPWNNMGKLWDHSPLKYADKVKTPTLFINSDQDYRCYLAEGIQMFTALKYHGVDARLCMFRGENHELSRSGKPKHRMRRLQEITDWFDKYLK
ncbi:MAG TPA: S9 family peptidase [Clostridiaceae bacterium]|jgi:dipeptidyl aminopeptidase/acylaminoacyl peptidase|nr:S9 family peptidase [Clostridiaceae bacterium]